MFGRNWIAGAALAALTASVAIACGPFFPWQLLDDRGQTLKATPVNSFAFEAKHLTRAPQDHLKPVELTDSFQPDQDRATQLSEAENQGLSKSGAALVLAARSAANGAQALQKGKGLPQAVLHYTAGAIAWRNSDFAFAQSEFSQVLQLPELDAKPRVVWAAYMLGKLAASRDTVSAAAYFRKTRVLALKGAPDPLGLAVASYGEEARLHLRAAEVLLRTAGSSVAAAEGTQPGTNSHVAEFAGSTLPPGSVVMFRDQIAQAIALYADQAAHGSDSGVQSLRMMAEFLLDRSDRIVAVVADPSAQRLLVAYALKRLDNNTIHIREWWLEGATKPGTGDAGLDRTLPVLIAALEKQPHPAGTDRLAALCYNIGNWKCAEALAAKTRTPLAAWVQAKLATQKGDLAGATKSYAAAVRGFPTTDSLEDDGKKQLLGESGVMALARGDYVDALEKLWPVSGTYWSDVAYLAERVLTVDELKTFVDTHVPPGKPPILDGKPNPYGTPFDSRVTLRDLLARRLMREERYGDAFAYFSDANVRQAAEDYAGALHASARAWTRIGKAEALFRAATIARHSGMDIMGTEGPPDSSYTQGEFEDGLGRAELKGPYITVGEKRRFTASTPKPNHRFHYRYVAIDEASHAADLLPHQSQAFAAVLCRAWNWSSREPTRAKTLYRRYIKEGPHVNWARHFGLSCPAPDFPAATSLERKLLMRDARRYVSHHRWWFASGTILGLALVTILVLLLTGRLSEPWSRWRS